MNVALKTNDIKKSWKSSIDDWTNDFDRIFNSMDNVIKPIQVTRKVLQSNDLEVDIFENDSSYLMMIDIPGTKTEDMNIEYSEQHLRIDSKRTYDPKFENFKCSIRQRTMGEFSKIIRLPDNVDPSRIMADYTDGVLSIEVAKKESAKPRKIEIKTGSSKLNLADSEKLN